MARRYGEPVAVVTRSGEDGQPAPTAFTWRGVTYQVRVIGRWRLSTRWWERETGAGKGAVDRVYFRVQTADQQVFELYCEMAGGAQHHGWALDVCLD